MDATSQLLLEVTSTIDSLFDSYVRFNALLPREHRDKEGRTPWKLKHFGRRKAALYGSIAYYIAVCGCISPGQDLPALNPIKLPITGKRPPSINALSAQKWCQPYFVQELVPAVSGSARPSSDRII